MIHISHNRLPAYSEVTGARWKAVVILIGVLACSACGSSYSYRVVSRHPPSWLLTRLSSPLETVLPTVDQTKLSLSCDRLPLRASSATRGSFAAQVATELALRDPPLSLNAYRALGFTCLEGKCEFRLRAVGVYRGWHGSPFNNRSFCYSTLVCGDPARQTVAAARTSRLCGNERSFEGEN